MPAPESEPPVIGMHPAVFALIIAVSAGLWVGCFKLMAALCRAMSPIVGGQ